MSEKSFRISHATCMACCHAWVAVVDDECVSPLECPSCHKPWGIEEPVEEGEEKEPKLMPCPRCKGRGVLDLHRHRNVRCENCGGSGKVKLKEEEHE
jgi:DnaJ-class molecular chaperone